MTYNIPFQKIFNLLSILGIIIVVLKPYTNIKETIDSKSWPLLNFENSSSMSNKSNQNVEVRDVSRRKRLPQVLIIGIMKCGTGALNTMMRMHSKIVTASNKIDWEVNFFNQDRVYKRGLDWYRNMMPYSYSDQYTLEKSVRYTENVDNVVPLRIHAMNSSIRLILIVKDPVTRTIGHYVHNKETGRTKGNWQESFDELVLSPDGEVNSMSPLIARSLYVTTMEFYYDVFSPKQILLVDGDQLIKDPLPILKMVEKFLKLQPEITKDYFYIGKRSRGFYCLNKTPNQTNNIGGCLQKAKGLGRKGRKHPEQNEDVLKKLRLFFAPYNKRFYDLVGHDFGW